MSQDSNSSPCLPQIDPPVHLNDPLVRRLPDSRARWSRAMRGRIPKPTDALVAKTLADYGNKDGSNCHPGVERLAADTCLSPKSVKRALAWLDEHGWISLQKRCARKLGLADVWQCTLPAPVAVELGVWPDDAPQWMERPPGTPKRPGVRDRPGPAKRGPKPKLLGVRNSDVGVRNSVLGVTIDPTPGPTAPGPISHHPDLLDRPHADASGSEDDLDELVEMVEEALGGTLGFGTESLIYGMAGRGAHFKAIVNAALAYERDIA